MRPFVTGIYRASTFNNWLCPPPPGVAGREESSRIFDPAIVEGPTADMAFDAHRDDILHARGRMYRSGRFRADKSFDGKWTRVSRDGTLARESIRNDTIHLQMELWTRNFQDNGYV